MTYCGCFAEENGFTFALNYSMQSMKGLGVFCFVLFCSFFSPFSLHCYSMCFILFYVSLSEYLILLGILQSYYGIKIMGC